MIPQEMKLYIENLLNQRQAATSDAERFWLKLKLNSEYPALGCDIAHTWEEGKIITAAGRIALTKIIHEQMVNTGREHQSDSEKGS
jgi:hypothetical protein